MWQFIKDFHFYRPAEKRAIVLLFTLIVATIGATIAYEHYFRPEKPSVDEAELQAFADSIQYHDSVARERRAYYNSRQTIQTSSNKPSRTYDKPRQTREKPEPKQRDTVRSLLLDTLPRYEKIEKYEAGTLVDFNKADTTELKKIPGIGSVIARMIVNYRNQLGGFYEVGQLQEINLDAEQLDSWFVVDEADIRKIPVNKSSVDRLRKHPYINFYQAKALVEHRRKHGDLQNLKPFVLYEEFTEEELERISHYLSFNNE